MNEGEYSNPKGREGQHMSFLQTRIDGFVLSFSQKKKSKEISKNQQSIFGSEGGYSKLLRIAHWLWTDFVNPSLDWRSARNFSEEANAHCYRTVSNMFGRSKVDTLCTSKKAGFERANIFKQLMTKFMLQLHKLPSVSTGNAGKNGCSRKSSGANLDVSSYIVEREVTQATGWKTREEVC